jgi:catechol 2,3-dioxygenase-like lactoylglutathione lyase family enzyme
MRLGQSVRGRYCSPMIKGVHAMFYTPCADELRAFLRDKLDLPYFDTGGGWLIFNAPEVEVGCHPGGENSHDISFYCDDIHATVDALKAKGVEFTSEVKDEGYGYTTHLRAPGDLVLQLYQPKYK